ncbi:polyketide synthase [Pseudonocardia sp. AL041005-10]|nr:SDR family NAD(P)-dependent oxidoreductase [Pseudonocardia sp. AL041005-10]ALE77176.1 polyketide synthase [Pseudonocardia sp. AL041005-10]
MSTGSRAGLPAVEDLTLEAPLALAETTPTQIRVVLSAADRSDRRPYALFARPASTADTTGGWTRHASGFLVGHDTDERGPGAPMGPSASAERVDLTDLLPAFADAGFSYGPVFRGLRHAWRDGTDVVAVATLPPAPGTPTTGFSIHPALLDAALQAIVASGLLDVTTDQAWMPFSWSDVRLARTSATTLLLRIRPVDVGVFAVLVGDEHGQVIGRIGALGFRRTTAEQVRAARESVPAVLAPAWRSIAAGSVPSRQPSWGVVGPADAPAPPGPDGQPPVPHFATIDDVLAADTRPRLLVLHVPSGRGEATTVSVAEQVTDVLDVVGRFLAAPLADTVLVVVTRSAQDVGDGAVVDLEGAAVWGLIRSAQTEHPDRLRLVDVDDDPRSRALWVRALAVGEAQMALRAGRCLVPRLEVLAAAPHRLADPLDGQRLGVPTAGTLEDLQWVYCPEVSEPLRSGQVRIRVHTAGLNFRDVTIALGLIPGTAIDAGLGSEGSGTVTETADDVTDLAVGDRVMGIFSGAFGPLAVADRRLLAHVPAGWSFAEAASMPGAFLTAYYALRHVHPLRRGERVLIHAAAGGVGMAAVRLAQLIGAEVYATASPAKWPALRAMGLDDDHLASSRDLDFVRKFLVATDGQGVHVVLNSLAHEAVDASLELMPRGGAFIEMGKTDIRDPRRIADDHPGVVYRAFDLYEAGPDVLAELFAAVLALFAEGRLRLGPIAIRDIREARDAFREMSRGRHVGKIVLELERDLGGGTVLVTGGTGAVGTQIARHLVHARGVRSLLLLSRSGPSAPHAQDLCAELTEAGAQVRIAACDVADTAAVTTVLAELPGQFPLTGVVHTAGVLADRAFTSLSRDDVLTALRAKVGGALVLHRLTEHRSLSQFIVFSALAGWIGTPGQANYAAANTTLDALAAQRRRAGLPGTSLGWGWWAEDSAMTAHLDQASIARIRRMGVAPMPTAPALALFDAAQDAGPAVTVPAWIDVPVLRHGDPAAVPVVLRDLARARSATPAGPDPVGTTRPTDLAGRVAELTPDRAGPFVLSWVQEQVAVVLGHPSVGCVEPDEVFTQLGFDSLTTVELCNRLSSATGLRVPSTSVFNHPTPRELAEHLTGLLVPDSPTGPQPDDLGLDALVDLALEPQHD